MRIRLSDVRDASSFIQSKVADNEGEIYEHEPRE
jgi:hypothetical protein